MSSNYQAQIDAFMDKVKATNGHEPEFIQAVHEVAEAIIPFMLQKFWTEWLNQKEQSFSEFLG
jgi:hypothetical protein